MGNFANEQEFIVRYNGWLESLIELRNENPLKNKQLHDIKEEYEQEKELWEYNQKN